MFSKDLKQFLDKRLDEKTPPEDMLQLCSEIEKLHKLLAQFYRYKFKLSLEPTKMGAKYLQKWTQQIQQKIGVWMKNAISMDNVRIYLTRLTMIIVCSGARNTSFCFCD